MRENYNKTSEKFENINHVIEICRKKYPELKDKVKKRVKIFVKEFKQSNYQNTSDTISPTSTLQTRSTPSPYSNDKNHHNIMSIDKLTNSHNDENKNSNNFKSLNVGLKREFCYQKLNDINISLF